MAGFILENMLSENGGMTRRICRLDKNGCLVGVKETSNKKLKFTYNIKGNELFVERKEKSITKEPFSWRMIKLGSREGELQGLRSWRSSGCSSLLAKRACVSCSSLSACAYSWEPKFS